MKKRFDRMGQLSIETIGLSTSRGRIIFFVLLSTIIFIVPAKWPFTFSVWQHLGIAAPSIGLTRAYRDLLHGEFTHAWQQNKLIYAVVIVGGIVLIKDVLTLLYEHTKIVAPAKRMSNRSD